MSETISCVWSGQSPKFCKEISTVKKKCKENLKLLMEIILAST